MRFLIDLAICSLVHELGHIVAAKLLGTQIKGVGFNLLGPYVMRGRAASPLADAAISMAGIAANLLLAIDLFASGRYPYLIAMNLALAAICAIPFPGLDGYHAWRTLRSGR